MAVYLSAVAVSIVALVLGAAVCRVLQVAGWLAPTLGLSAAMLIVEAAVRLPGRISTAVAALGAALVVAVAVIVRAGFDARAARGAAATGVPVALIVLAGCSLPFVAYGRIGELGPGFSADPFFHMGQADAMRAVGLDAHVTSAAYPIGPHTLVATLGAGLGIATQPVFLGLLLAIPVLTGLTALAALGDLSPWRRMLGASLVAVPYLPASYFAQGSFKEPMLASCFLASALALRSAGRRRRPATGALAAIVLATGGGVVAFGWLAVAWPLAMLALYAVIAAPKDVVCSVLAESGARRRTVLVAVLAVVALLGLVVAAQASGFFGGSGKYLFAKGTGGNFAGQLSPLEAVGTWPASDFRYRPEGHRLVFDAIVAFGAGVVLWGLVWCWRRGEHALLAGAGAGLLVYAVSWPFTLAYNSGKALVVVAPVLTLVALRALLAGRPRRPHATRWRVAWIAIAVAFVGATAGSTALALRAALPRPHDVPDDLTSLLPIVKGKPTLYLGRSDWAGWDLRASKLAAFHGAATPLAERLRAMGSKAPLRNPTDSVDVDSLPTMALNRFAYVIGPRTAFLSTVPGNFRLVRRTRWFDLWKREGRSRPRLALDDKAGPGAVLPCANPFIAALARRGAIAYVRPRPVVRPEAAWGTAAGAPAPGGIQPGRTLSQTLDLGRGMWELALSYESGVSLRVRAPGLDRTLPAYVEDRSLLLPAGRIAVSAPHEQVRVEVSAQHRPLEDRWMVLGRLVATRVDRRGRVVPLARACGRYVDWIEPR